MRELAKELLRFTRPRRWFDLIVTVGGVAKIFFRSGFSMYPASS
jgi:hypothetical protein